MDLYFSHTVPNQHGFVQLCTCRAALHTWEQKWHTKISKRCVCLVYQPSNQTGSNYEITRRQIQELRDKQAFQIYVASCSETKQKNEPTDVEKRRFQHVPGNSRALGHKGLFYDSHLATCLLVCNCGQSNTQWCPVRIWNHNAMSQVSQHPLHEQSSGDDVRFKSRSTHNVFT